jgi:hypothetical protein
MYGKIVRLNASEIRSSDETHAHKDPSDALDREKTRFSLLSKARQGVKNQNAPLSTDKPSLIINNYWTLVNFTVRPDPAMLRSAGQWLVEGRTAQAGPAQQDSRFDKLSANGFCWVFSNLPKSR